MDHTEATANQATERYLLGELNADETSAFEEHYFDCRECAEDVRAGMAFFEGGRRLVRDEKARPAAPVAQISEHPRWRRWLPAAAAAMFAYLTMVPVLMRGPVTTASTAEFEFGDASVALEMTRDEDAVPTVQLQGNERASCYFEFPQTDDGEPYERYAVRLIGPERKVLTTRTYTREVGGQSRPLTMRAAKAGNYELEISCIGPAGRVEKVERRQFVVKR